MKRSIRLLVLMLAAALGAASIAFSDPATFAGAPREKPGPHAVYEHSTEHRINGFDRDGQSNNTRLVPSNPLNELEAQRLKLMFLLMMSLGPYRTPVR
jgi:hypothetical protein